MDGPVGYKTQEFLPDKLRKSSSAQKIQDPKRKQGLREMFIIFLKILEFDVEQLNSVEFEELRRS